VGAPNQPRRVPRHGIRFRNRLGAQRDRPGRRPRQFHATERYRRTRRGHSRS